MCLVCLLLHAKLAQLANRKQNGIECFHHGQKLILPFLTQGSLNPLLLPPLQLSNLLHSPTGEQPREKAVIETEDAGKDGEPVEETEVATQNEHHLQVKIDS